MVTYTDPNGIKHVIMSNGDHYMVRGNHYVKVQPS